MKIRIHLTRQAMQDSVSEALENGRQGFATGLGIRTKARHGLYLVVIR